MDAGAEVREEELATGFAIEPGDHARKRAPELIRFLSPRRLDFIPKLAEVFDLAPHQDVAAAFDDFQIAPLPYSRQISPPPPGEVMRRQLVRVCLTQSDDAGSVGNGDGQIPAGFEQASGAGQKANWIRNMLKHFEGRDQIEALVPLPLAKIRHQAGINSVPFLGAGPGSLRIKFDSERAQSGFFRQIEESAAAATHVHHAVELPPNGKLDGPRERRRVLWIIIRELVLQLPVEDLAARERKIKKSEAAGCTLK